MGSQFKAAALEEHTAKAIKQWHKDVKQKRKKHNHHHHHDLDSSLHQEGSSHSTVTEHQSSRVFESSSSRTLSSQEMVNSFHHRAPTFSEFNSLDIIESSEMVEEPIKIKMREINEISEIGEIHEEKTLTTQTQRWVS